MSIFLNLIAWKLVFWTKQCENRVLCSLFRVHLEAKMGHFELCVDFLHKLVLIISISRDLTNFLKHDQIESVFRPKMKVE